MTTYSESAEQDDIEFRLKQYPLTTRRIAQYGFLELEDSWGDEATIINTARISTTDNVFMTQPTLRQRIRRY